MPSEKQTYSAVGGHENEHDDFGSGERLEGTGDEEVLQTKTVHLDQRMKMKQMEIVMSGDRSPTELNLRRRIVLCLFFAFLVAIFVITIAEVSLHGPKSDIVAVTSRSNTRRDVYLMQFTVNGKKLTWAQKEIIESIEFARVFVEALQSEVPFRDYSIEVRKHSSADRVEIACIEEDSRRIDTEIRCQEHILTLVQTPIDRCEAASGKTELVAAVSCDGVKGKILVFWQNFFEKTELRHSYSSRCCDFDSMSNEEKSDLKLCRQSEADLNDQFLRFYGKEKTYTCRKSLCGCSCMSDKVGKAFDGSATECPKLPEKYNNNENQLCTDVMTFLSKHQVKCMDVPQLAENFKTTLKALHIDLGRNLRCYGQGVKS